MFYLVEFSSGVTSSYMIAVGIILVVLSSHSPKVSSAPSATLGRARP